MQRAVFQNPLWLLNFGQSGHNTTTTLARHLIGAMMSKQNMETNPGATEVTTSLIFFTHLPSPELDPGTGTQLEMRVSCDWDPTLENNTVLDVQRSTVEL